MTRKNLKLGFRQDTTGESITAPGKVCREPGHLDYIGSDTEDHGLRASTIKRFISRTAAWNPVNRARATIA